MRIVALRAWKQSGKDTAAEQLVKKHGFTRVAFADVLKDMVAEEYNIPRNFLDDPERKEMPLKEYPVDPKDSFSIAITNLMFGEFRNELGKKSKYSDFLESTVNKEKLYWTPRALAIFKGSGNRAVTSKYWTQRAINEIHSKAKPYVAEFKEPYECSDGTPIVGAIRENGNFVISDLRYKSEVEELRKAFGDDLFVVLVDRFDICNSTDASERDMDDFNEYSFVLSNRSTLDDFMKGVDTLAWAIKTEN